MQFLIVTVATFVALFWDEAVITLYAAWFGRKLSRKFLISWVLASGLLGGLLISLHVPPTYRTLTMILFTAGIAFSINGLNQKEH